jgi:tetratricopeptide (TPR) repeat protein
LPVKTYDRLRRAAFVAAAAVVLGVLWRALPAEPSSAAQKAPEAKATVEDVLQKAADFEACDEYKAAIETLKAAYAGGMRDMKVLKPLAIVELKAGAVRDAGKHIDEALSQSKGNPELILWSAVQASAAGGEALAAKRLSAGLEAAGSDEVQLYDLAEGFLRSGALSVSAALYRKINKTYPTESMFDQFGYLHLMAYYGFTGRDAEAAKIIEDAKKSFEYADVELLTAQETDYLIGYFKGKAAIRAGDVTGGVNILRDTAVRMPDGAVADGEIVKALDAAGRSDEADGVYSIVSKRFNDAIASSPEKYEAYHNLALFVAASGRADKEGLDACEWALRLAPLRPEYLATKAALLENAGKYAEALVAIERATVLVLAPRWAEPAQFDEFIFRRMEILGKMGRPVPAAFMRLPEPTGK